MAKQKNKQTTEEPKKKGRPVGILKLDADEIFKAAMDIIESNPEVVLLADVKSMLPISERCFYNYIPRDSEYSNKIHEALERNIVNLKTRIRAKLFNMNNPTALIALYKLVGDKDDRNALANNPKDPDEKQPTNTNIELKFS